MLQGCTQGCSCCAPECTKIARFSAVAAAIFTAPPQNRAIFEAPRGAICSAKKIASERRFSLRLRGTNLIPAAEFPATPESAAKTASERRCAILVHSAVHINRKSTLGSIPWSISLSTLWSTPPSAPISVSTLTSTSQSTFRDFPL